MIKKELAADPKLKNENLSKGSKIGVFVCGNDELCRDIKKMCIEKRLFQSKYKIFDYWTKMQRWVINESEFPSPGLRDKLPEQLLSDLNYLNKLEKEMYLVRYDASRRGFFAGNHASNKVTNFEEYTKHVIGKSV